MSGKGGKSSGQELKQEPKPEPEPQTNPYAGTLKRLRDAFDSGRTRPAEFRVTQLRALSCFLKENRKLILESLKKDMGKPAVEADVSEIVLCESEIKLALNNLHTWMKDEKVEKNLASQLDSAFIRKEPYGVTLIIAPWNYPLNLLLVPLVGAIAAGNCVILKPSEISENMEKVIAKVLPRYLDQHCFATVVGGPPGGHGAAPEQVRLHLLHRELEGGPGRHGGCLQARDPHHARAGREEPLLRGRRLRPPERGQPRGLVPFLQRGADVRGPRLRAVQPGDAGEAAAGPAARRDPVLRGGPPALPPPGPHHQRQALPAAPGAAGQRPSGHRRPVGRAGALHRPHRAGGGPGDGPGDAGGDLWAHLAHPDRAEPGRGRGLPQQEGEAPGPVCLLQQSPGGE
ncbi:N-succinylglutamate 5-semialdehyde dehydrogenase-like [Monodelphis domestica]|uniref:N-succinylglutamate 5-semialdehyde dehydrogenase-like n=1 Tax=Monodelphis domestica TaxID=13616 RepID=UPI0024E1A54B|nr:N-succinylglutamate 5-semialdehyde dehydrogenase-like [Monodelphis domestica]XP_056657173.1 N-succinylglutamate 5-semialdehyde dehydrogenase-like [Monodelphis domestica]